MRIIYPAFLRALALLVSAACSSPLRPHLTVPDQVLTVTITKQQIQQSTSCTGTNQQYCCQSVADSGSFGASIQISATDTVVADTTIRNLIAIVLDQNMRGKEYSWAGGARLFFSASTASSPIILRVDAGLLDSTGRFGPTAAGTYFFMPGGHCAGTSTGVFTATVK